MLLYIFLATIIACQSLYSTLFIVRFDCKVLKLRCYCIWASQTKVTSYMKCLSTTTVA